MHGQQQQCLTLVYFHTQRILARDVVFPTGITPECRDLLDRLLTLDPAHRITVAQIQAHPWCAHCLDVATRSTCSTTCLTGTGETCPRACWA